MADRQGRSFRNKMTDKKYFLIVDRRNFWQIFWINATYSVVIKFSYPKLFSWQVRLSYPDWKSLAHTFWEAMIHRTYKKDDKILLSINADTRYLGYSIPGKEFKPDLSDIPTEMHKYFNQPTVSEQDKKNRVFQTVLVSFPSNKGIAFYFDREVYVQLEKDLLDAENKINQILNRKPTFQILST